MPTSDDVMQLAGECAARVSLPRRRRRYPNFAEVEEQCAEEYEELLALLHEDEIFAPADLGSAGRSRAHRPGRLARAPAAARRRARRQPGGAGLAAAGRRLPPWRRRRPAAGASWRRRRRTRTKTTRVISTNEAGWVARAFRPASWINTPQLADGAALLFVGPAGRHLRGAEDAVGAPSGDLVGGGPWRAVLVEASRVGLGNRAVGQANDDHGLLRAKGTRQLDRSPPAPSGGACRAGRSPRPCRPCTPAALQSASCNRQETSSHTSRRTVSERRQPFRPTPIGLVGTSDLMPQMKIWTLPLALS